LANTGAFPNIVYPAGKGKLKNYGDTLKFYPSATDGVFNRPDGVYNLAQFHIHMPSEHRVNADEWPGEIHCKPFCDIFFFEA
jgi:carbonic anhydrase